MSLKQFFLALCIGVVLVQTGLQCAKAQPPYEITLEDEFGNTLPSYAQRGDTFALGREGQRYNVRISNHTGRRIEAVVSVDGRDVLTGQPGDYKRLRGYIVPAYGSVVIDGFRQSLDSVAAFRFTTPGDSYSSRMGTPENVGVIGAAIFPEAAPRAPVAVPKPYYRAPEPHYYGDAEGVGGAGRGAGGGGLGSSGPHAAPPTSAERKGADKSSAPSASAPAREESARSRGYAESPRDDSSNIGTEYGETTHSQVSEVSFKRARHHSPERVLTMRYDDYQGLVARGVLPRPAPRRPVYGPSAFPVNRFAPPPPPRPYWN
jgi:hypothetical protein